MSGCCGTTYDRVRTAIAAKIRLGYRLKYSMLEERLEQVREIDGELAYGKMRRAVEKASQEKARQEKARQVEWASLDFHGTGKN